MSLNPVDEFMFEHSLEGNEKQRFITSEKLYTAATDSNGGSYSNNQILFDKVDGLFKGPAYTLLSDSFILAPLTLTLTNKTASTSYTETADVNNDFAASLKNGVQHLINRVNIMLDGQQLNWTATKSNLEMQWRLMQMSREDVQNFGDIINFSMDTPTSVRFNNGVSQYGLGECNNSIKSITFDPNKGFANVTAGSDGSIQNTGRLTRMRSTSFNPSRAATISYYVANTQKATDSFMNNVACTSNTVIYSIYAIIPLSIIHPIFDKLPLMRNFTLTLTLDMNTNSSVDLVNAAQGAAGGAANFSSYTSYTPNGTLPFMISPIGEGFNPNNSTATNAKLVIGANAQPSCQFYACKYALTTDEDARYLANPVKYIPYLDYTYFYISEKSAGAQIQETISSSANNLRYLLIVPQLGKTANSISANGAITLATSSAMESPFSSSPATTAPYCKLRNFNVKVGDNPLYRYSKQYAFEQYMEEVRPALSHNGGALQSKGFSSGLLSKTAWEAGHNYYYIDLSRKEDTVDHDNTSIDLSFLNNSSVPLEFHVFLGRERNITLNVGNGQIA